MIRLYAIVLSFYLIFSPAIAMAKTPTINLYKPKASTIAKVGGVITAIAKKGTGLVKVTPWGRGLTYMAMAYTLICGKASVSDGIKCYNNIKGALEGDGWKIDQDEKSIYKIVDAQCFPELVYRYNDKISTSYAIFNSDIIYAHLNGDGQSNDITIIYDDNYEAAITNAKNEINTGKYNNLAYGELSQPLGNITGKTTGPKYCNNVWGCFSTIPETYVSSKKYWHGKTVSQTHEISDTQLIVWDTLNDGRVLPTIYYKTQKSFSIDILARGRCDRNKQYISEQEMYNYVYNNATNEEIKNIYNYDYDNSTTYINLGNGNKITGADINGQLRLSPSLNLSPSVKLQFESGKLSLPNMNKKNCKITSTTIESCKNDDGTDPKDPKKPDPDKPKPPDPPKPPKDKDKDDDFKLPKFCDWASKFCDWMDWTKEPAKDNSDTKVDVKKQEQPKINQDLINWKKTCPPPDKVHFNMLGIDVNYQYDFKPSCMFAHKIKPWITGVGWVLGAFILSGYSLRRKDDG